MDTYAMAFLILAALVVLWAVVYMYFNKREIAYHAEADIHIDVLKSIRPAIWDVFREKAGVGEEHHDAFDELFLHILNNRLSYDPEKCMSWMSRLNPEFDIANISLIEDEVKLQRERAVSAQQCLQEVSRSRDAYIRSFPARIFVRDKRSLDAPIMVAVAEE